MVPVLAALGAVGTIDKLATGALAAWKALSSPERAGGKAEVDAPGSFGALMRAHGISADSPVGAAVSALSAALPGRADAEPVRMALDATAGRTVNRLA